MQARICDNCKDAFPKAKGMVHIMIKPYCSLSETATIQKVNMDLCINCYGKIKKILKIKDNFSEPDK